MSVVSEAVQLRSTDPREALARWPPYQYVRKTSCNQPLEVQIFDIALVAGDHKGRRIRLSSADIVSVGAGCSLVDVDGGENVATGGLKAEAEAPCTAEEVYNTG